MSFCNSHTAKYNEPADKRIHGQFYSKVFQKKIVIVWFVFVFQSTACDPRIWPGEGFFLVSDLFGDFLCWRRAMSLELYWDGGLEVRGPPEVAQSIKIQNSLKKFQLLLTKNLLCAWLSKRRNFFSSFAKNISKSCKSFRWGLDDFCKGPKNELSRFESYTHNNLQDDFVAWISNPI